MCVRKIEKVKGKCSVCGKETGVVVACSPLGAMTNAYCEVCSNLGIEPYGDVVATVWSVGSTIDDLNECARDIAEKTLKFFGKTSDDLAEDVRFMEEMFMEEIKNFSGSSSVDEDFPFELE